MWKCFKEKNGAVHDNDHNHDQEQEQAMCRCEQAKKKSNFVSLPPPQTNSKQDADFFLFLENTGSILDIWVKFPFYGF
jgi:hypothetical protein